MAKIREVDVYLDVADEAEAKALIASSMGGPLAGHPDMLCRGGAVEHDHPIAQSHYQLDEAGKQRLDEAGKPILNALRDDNGKVIADRKGRPQFAPPLAGKLRVRLNYR